MMEYVFIFCWTGFFMAGFFLLLRKIVSPWRVYLLVALNLIFLAGVFYFYPVPGQGTHSADLSWNGVLEPSPGNGVLFPRGWS